MTPLLQTGLVYAGAALAEIAGCFAFWTWLRSGRSAWWAVPGIAALAIFAWALTRAPSAAAGRAFAAYGGVYIVGCLAWLWLVEGRRPDLWDLGGAGLALAGAGMILFGPRQG